MGSVAFSEIRDAFERYLEAERNLSVHTIRAYMGDLDSFFEHLEKLDLNNFSNLDLSHIRSWLANQQVKGGARTTLSRRAVSIRLFTKWATKKGYLAKDVGSTLATPKGARTLPDVLSIADAGLAMDAMATRVAQEEGPISLRDCAMLEVLYASGARVSELCGLDLQDIDYERNTIRVLGKGNKERTIPLGNPAMRALEAWLKQGRDSLAGEKSERAVFLLSLIHI
jgi:integrase/recombinase XerC